MLKLPKMKPEVPSRASLAVVVFAHCELYFQSHWPAMDEEMDEEVVAWISYKIH